MATCSFHYPIRSEAIARLSVVALAALLLAGAAVPAAATADDPTATPGDTDLEETHSDSDQSGTAPLALSISPKRALVSLAFLGAVAARRRRTPV
ncbi:MULTISPECIES: hypothetical protein [Halobacterium]|uniref:hypothetical protein n=1 Tax=Halobacterium TaxID=2239 RepID=UPI00073F3DAA|nr:MULTISPECIES: hypothetical protein [Halobacterium]MCG1004371.1 hypothetical protein [Halobacterium noricense]